MISICDVAGNCFRYDFIEATTEAPEGRYVLDEKVKKLLGNTPFVRYSFDEALNVSFTKG